MMQPATATSELEALLMSMTQRERISVLLSIGVPAVDVIGVKKCGQHDGGRELRDSEGLTFDGYTVWCIGCSTWWSI